jgi:nicotinamide-nucleotide amidase
VSDLVERVSELLVRRRLRLVTAESCTGGMVAARFTDLPGASRFFDAGLVTYSDAAKRDLLGVQAATLDAHGAVSRDVVMEMLEGALRPGGAAVAITGIAGPEGGTEDKPVGTVWIAAGVGSKRAARRFHFPEDRAAVRESSVVAALEMLEAILGE